MKKWDSHAKSSTISIVYRCCCCNFFRQNPRRFPCIFSGMCFLPKENQQPIWGSHRFFRRKVKPNTHILSTIINELFIAKVSSSNNTYSFRKISPCRRNLILMSRVCTCVEFVTVCGAEWCWFQAGKYSSRGHSCQRCVGLQALPTSCLVEHCRVTHCCDGHYNVFLLLLALRKVCDVQALHVASTWIRIR